MLILVGGLIVLIVILGIIIVVARNRFKTQDTFHKNEINSLNKQIKMWEGEARKAIDEAGEFKKEIKNLNIENDAINDQRNAEKDTYVLEHNQIQEIRKILES